MNTPKQQTKSRAGIEEEHERKLRELDEQYLARESVWESYSERVALEDIRYEEALADIEDWQDYDKDIPY